ncbi:hypothetical protein [Gordonia rhizosphera]|uniref:MPT63-like domain-containing protein n=1 Tax=Gordonia rhizosphera NBRC 16068 TaxID=1108045 RepID=K6WHK5_9ACTN|nr:hypothetical protein [Gordonia rhizosphera]GAB91642.1 hypothetical protein GORHZ_141_00170 [Gordonia rhizosphera NBRC 16068]
MTHLKARTAVAAATAVMAGGAMVAAAPAATASPTPPPNTQSLYVSGDMAIAPGVHLLNIKAMGMRTANGTTSGRYVATVLDGRNPTPIQVRGPITCLYTNGDTASLIYPITGTTPDVLPADLRGAAAVQITVRKGSSSNRVGVMGPMPTSSFQGCKPGMTPFGFDGVVSINHR